LPTGSARDELDVAGVGRLQVTCIDNGMPMVLLHALDMGRTGYETAAEMNGDLQLKTKVEALRLKAGHLMGLGDVGRKNYPKMCLISAPRQGGSINTRCFIPHVCHDAIGVLAAVTVGTACVLEGSITQGIAVTPTGPARKTISIEHPTGEFSVELELDPKNSQIVLRAALLRTARLIMRGEVMVPVSVWRGKER
jgi:4-oxalomesaconate tautomerase